MKQKNTLGKAIFYQLEKNEYLNEIYDNLLFNYSYIKLNLNINSKQIELFDALRFADLLSKSIDSPNSEFHKSLSQEIIAMILFLNPHDINVLVYASSILSNIGNYRGMTLLNNNYSISLLDDVYQIIEKDFLRIPHSNEEMYFFPSQKEIYQKFSFPSFSYSGPTSMGKSLLIKTFIKSKIAEGINDNFAIIIPTKALINEIFSDLVQELDELLIEKNYRIVTSHESIVLQGKHNFILINTPERLLYFLISYPKIKIGYAFFDEAQKISSNSSRSAFYYKVVDMIYNRNRQVKVVFSSPNIANPDIYLKLIPNLEIDKHKYMTTNFSPVNQFKYLFDGVTNKISIYNRLKKSFMCIGEYTPSNNDILLSLLLDNKNNQNLVYINSKEEIIETSKKYANLLEEIDDTKVMELSKSIKNEIHGSYYLADLIKKGVAYHIGYLPTHIRMSIEDLYRQRIIKTIFCTSTLLEGVNLPADNIFITSINNGPSKLSNVEFKNLIGRVGRIKYNLCGNVYIIKKDRQINKQNLVRMLKSKKEKQELSLVSELSNEDKQLIIDTLLSGSTMFQFDCQDSNHYELIRKFAIILLKDIQTNNNSIVKRAFDEFLDCTTIRSIKRKFSKYSHNIGDDINISLDQTLNLQEAIKNGLQYPILNHRNDYSKILAFLEKLAYVFNWGYYENNTLGKIKNCKFINLPRYAVMLDHWMNGKGLKYMISSSMNDKKKIQSDGNTKKIMVSYNHFEYYDDSSISHRNIVISDILKTLDSIILFKISNYFLKFTDEYKKIHNINNLENDWYEYVEFGSMDKLIIFLQRNGYTREAANYINENMQTYIIYDNDDYKIKKDILNCNIEYIVKETNDIILNVPELFIE